MERVVVKFYLEIKKYKSFVIMNSNSVANSTHNLKQLMYLSKEEKSVLHTRLQAELSEFRERERVYIEKR